MHTWSNTIVDDTVIMGGAPFGFLQIPQRLKNDYNVCAVINLCEEYDGPSRLYDELGIEELRVPTTDHFEPSVHDIIQAVQFIQRYKDYNDDNERISIDDNDEDYDVQGEEKKDTDSLLTEKKMKERPRRVYIHCRAGHGRSAAIVYAWLMHQQQQQQQQQQKELNHDKNDLHSNSYDDDYNDFINMDMKELNEYLSSKRNVRTSLWKQPNVNKYRSWLEWKNHGVI